MAQPTELPNKGITEKLGDPDALCKRKKGPDSFFCRVKVMFVLGPCEAIDEIAEVFLLWTKSCVAVRRCVFFLYMYFVSKRSLIIDQKSPLKRLILKV